MNNDIRQLLLDLRALLTDLHEWSRDSDKIADLAAAIKRIDDALEI